MWLMVIWTAAAAAEHELCKLIRIINEPIGNLFELNLGIYGTEFGFTGHRKGRRMRRWIYVEIKFYGRPPKIDTSRTTINWFRSDYKKLSTESPLFPAEESQSACVLFFPIRFPGTHFPEHQPRQFLSLFSH